MTELGEKDALGVCVTMPKKVNSNGIWDMVKRSGIWDNKKDTLRESPIFSLLFQMTIIFGVNALLRLFILPLRLPKLTHHIIAGMAIATLFNLDLNCKTFKWVKYIVNRLEAQEILGLLSVFGYTLFFFFIAVKMDMSIVHKTRRKAMTIGVLSTLVPYVVGMIFRFKYPKTPGVDANNNEIPFLVPVLSATAFPVIASLLDELKILNSELGRLGLSAGIVADLFTSILLFLTSSASRYLFLGGAQKTYAFFQWGGMVVFFLVVLFFVRPFLLRIARNTPEGSPVSESSLYLVLLMVVFSGFVTFVFSQPVFFGPYILGLLVPEGPPLGSALVEKLEPFVSDFLLPLFVTTSAMRLDLHDLITRWKPAMYRASYLMVLAFLVKLVACILPALYYRMPLQDSLILALIISCKGIVELAAYCFIKDSNFISDGTFAVLGMSVLIIGTIQPLLIKYLYDPSKKYAGYTKRSIMDMKPNSDLRMVVCIHGACNIPSMIGIIEASCPTKEDPIIVDVLHLIELVGRASPAFISHQFQKKTAIQGSCSEKLLVAFGHFERQYWESLTINMYSAFSLQNMMFEDICTLALDKVANLIILPFHRNWSEEGTSFKLEDIAMRQLNSAVLNRAPCSVGVLIDRGQTSQSSERDTPYSVCVIFLGGPDDREALAFAKRMVKETQIRLTIVRFTVPISDQVVVESDWDTRIDYELLKDLRCSAAKVDGYVTYIEEEVKDGPETALIVRPMVEDYDLVIVGRCYGVESIQTSGLKEWSEFPELGVLGDLLASKDLESRASVLVMQQQKMKAC